LTVDTTKPGSASNTFILPPGAGDFDYTVDWGDGVVESFVTSAVRTHVYSTPGIKNISITGTFPAIWFNFAGDREKVIEVQLGDVNWTSFYWAFAGCINLETIYGFANTSAVTTFQRAFWVCVKLNTDFSMINTNSCTNMESMLASCSIFNSSISHFNTNNVTNMANMFHGALQFNQPVNYFDVQNVKNMASMFYDCPAFNQSLSSWVTSSLTDMNLMLVTNNFQQSLATFDMSEVTNVANLMGGTPRNLGTANYDATLISWAAQNLVNGLSVDFGVTKYSAGAATTARQYIVNSHGWTIVDGGQQA